jgi:hypothetical protein
LQGQKRQLTILQRLPEQIALDIEEKVNALEEERDA